MERIIKKYSFENPHLQLWIMLGQTNDVLHKVRERRLAKYGITASQATVVFVINALDDNATINEISTWVFREPHSISSILKTMERNGLIEKEKRPSNKGGAIVHLTKKGKAIYKKMENMKFFVDILSCLSEEERKNLESYLKKLSEKAIHHLAELKYAPYL